jgi:cation-transporting ATPase E
VGLTLLTVGVPTFFLTRWASPAAPDERLLANLGRFVVPAAIVTAGFGTAVYAILYESVTTFLTSGSAPAHVIADFESYTGLRLGTDPEFVSAAAAIGAQTGLSTFFCLASFILILFIAPPTRFFAAWTRPTGDQRPTLLVGVLIVVFAAVLFVPALSTYFGLTGPGQAVFNTVLPALVLWFAVLTLVLRLRLLDRILKLDQINGPATRA